MNKTKVNGFYNKDDNFDSEFIFTKQVDNKNYGVKIPDSKYQKLWNTKGNKMSNIPIYRAKKIDSDEYVFGVPRQDSKDMYEMIINVVDDGVAGVIQRYIDATTLSIHFPDMLDSQGNKIFASLNEDGKGGDIIKALTRPVNNFQKEKMLDNVIIFDTFYYRLKSIIISKVENYNNIDISYLIQYRKNISTPFEVIGIQK